MSFELPKIHLKPTKTLQLEGKCSAFAQSFPSGEFFIIGDSSEFTLFEDLAPLHKFSMSVPSNSLRSLAIHPSKKLFAVASGAEANATVELYNLDGLVLQFHLPPVSPGGVDCPAVGFDQKGNFFLATETNGTTAFYVWDKDCPVSDYAELARATASHQFPSSFTGVMLEPSYRSSRSLLMLFDGHGGTIDYYYFQYLDEELSIEEPIANLSGPVAFSRDHSEFVTTSYVSDQPLGIQKYSLQKPLDPDPDRRAFIQFETVGKQLTWAGYIPEQEDQDHPTDECFYLDSNWVVFPSDDGVMYVVDTRKMTWVAELVVKGCDSPKVCRCGRYLMARNGSSVSFVETDEITKALGELL